jgi:hypothetical protein
MKKDIARRNALLESETIAMFSRWIEKSQVRVRVRRIGKGEKIIVDLYEFSPSPVELSNHQLNRVAINAAVAHSCITSTDYTLIHKFSTERKAMRIDGSWTVTNITEKSYVFSGVI